MTLVFWVVSWGITHRAQGIPGLTGSYIHWETVDLFRQLHLEAHCQISEPMSISEGTEAPRLLIPAWTPLLTGDVQSQYKVIKNYTGQAFLQEKSTLLSQCNFSTCSHRPGCRYTCFQRPSFLLFQTSRQSSTVVLLSQPQQHIHHPPKGSAQLQIEEAQLQRAPHFSYFY